MSSDFKLAPTRNQADYMARYLVRESSLTWAKAREAFVTQSGCTGQAGIRQKSHPSGWPVNPSVNFR